MAVYREVEGVLCESVLDLGDGWEQWEPVDDVAGLVRGLEIAYEESRKERARLQRQVRDVVKAHENAKAETLRLAAVNKKQAEALARFAADNRDLSAQLLRR